MDYQETIDFLYSQLPMFQRIGPSAFKKDLSNTIALCQALGNPQTKFPSIHIAGTNGKGSSSHMIAAVLQCAGYKTGLYTSPHLKNFTERIKVNGIEIDRQSVVDFVSKYKNLIESIRPSFFELTVAMAFDYFAKSKIDIAVIEVGLGGRLDSTNIIYPLISLITNISYDHQSFLGDTLPEIAFEKAGIIKENIPVVISQSQDETRDVFTTIASQRNASIHFADHVYQIVRKSIDGERLKIDVFSNNRLVFEDLKLGLVGYYQVLNIPGVLMTLEILKEHYPLINESVIRDGLEKVITLTGLKGRWQILERNPLVVCDTGHNEDGIAQVLEQIKLTIHDRLFMIFGTVKDKDLSKILSILPNDAYYFFCEAEIPRALPAQQLYDLAKTYGLNGKVIKNVSTAIAEAKKLATSNDMIFIGGSNFVVAEIENL